MLKIRLKRIGRKHDPSYRLVVVESSRGPKSGQYIENLGLYDPRKNVKQINVERVSHWVSQGAQVSDTAHNLLVDLGAREGSKINVLPQKSPVVPEKTEQEEAPEKPADAEGAEEPSSEPEEEKDEGASESNAEPSPETPEEESTEETEETPEENESEEKTS